MFPFLIVGLGNPGTKYENTRHNVGFQVIDELAKRWKLPSSQKKFNGQFVDALVDNQRVLFLKPETFMNLSGDAVQAAIHFYKLDPEKQMIVLSDDLDIPTGQVRMRLLGGTGGHNGLKSITACLNTEKYARIRIGIGRDPEIPTENYVLMKIPKAEQKIYEETVQFVCDGLEQILKNGLEKSMNFVNQKRNNEP